MSPDLSTTHTASAAQPSRTRGPDFPTASLTMPRVATIGSGGRPVLAPGVRLLHLDDGDGGPVWAARLVQTFPTGYVREQDLDGTVTELLRQCTGSNTFAEVITATVTSLLGPAAAGASRGAPSERAALASSLSDLVASLVTAGILRFT